MKKTVKIFTLIILVYFIINPFVFTEATSSIYSKTEIEAIVREKLSINNEIKLNYSNFYTQDTRQKKLWSLEFVDEKGNIYVTVDAESGEILNLHKWRNDFYGKPVSILPDKAKEIAISFIKSLEPEKFKETEEVTFKVPSIIIFELRRNYYELDNYHFLFVRKVKEEFFPNNYFRVQVSGVTGDIIQYEMSWDEVVYENNRTLISEEDARKIFEKEDRLELKYVALNTNNKDQGKVPILTPVYIYTPKESDKINAFDGRLYKMEELYQRWPDYRPVFSGAMEDIYAKEMAVYYERGEVIPEEGVLSKEKVEKILLDNLGKELDIKGLKVQNSHYTNYYYGMKGKFWSSYWWDEEKGKSLYAVVDAEEGNILSIDYNKPLSYDELVDLERLTIIKKDVSAGILPMEIYEKELENAYKKSATSQKENINKDNIKDEIIKKVQRIFPNVKKEEIKFEINLDMSEESLVYGNSSRYIDGIPYDANYLNLSYDYNIGEILKLNYRWNKVQPQPSYKVLDKKKIVKQFYDTVGFERYLVQLRDQKAAKEGLDIPLKQLVPIYTLKTYDFAFIDGISGKLLNYNGEEYIEDILLKEEFKDIKNHPYEREILLMDKMGILKENSTLFRPNDMLLKRDAIKWIIEMGFKGRGYYLDGYYEYYQKMQDVTLKDIDEKDPYYPYIVAAIKNGIIDENQKYFKPLEKTNKLEVTKWLLRAMKQKNLAEFSQIFQVPYTDAEQINYQDIGYVALAKYYNFYDDKNINGAFQPEKVLTRAEFIKVLYNLLNN